jgi:hypothetical protein
VAALGLGHLIEWGLELGDGHTLPGGFGENQSTGLWYGAEAAVQRSSSLTRRARRGTGSETSGTYQGPRRGAGSSIRLMDRSGP